MTEAERLALEPGVELDRLVVLKVLKLDYFQKVKEARPLQYSTDISAAWLIVEKMIVEGWNMDVGWYRDGNTWTASLSTDWDAFPDARILEADGKSAPEAICKAALLAKTGGPA